jgi:hypothetical protein
MTVRSYHEYRVVEMGSCVLSEMRGRPIVKTRDE